MVGRVVPLTLVVKDGVAVPTVADTVGFAPVDVWVPVVPVPMVEGVLGPLFTTLVSFLAGLSPAVFLAIFGVAVAPPGKPVLGAVTIAPRSVVTSGSDAFDWRFFRIAMN